MKRRTAILIIGAIVAVGALSQLAPAASSNCERPYRERLLSADKRVEAARTAVEAIKSQGKPFTDTPAWSEYLSATANRDLIRDEMRLHCP